MKVHLYCLCWNEATIIPAFLRHYGSWVDRFFVYDNRSTDDSVALLRADNRVTVTSFGVSGDSFVLAEQELSDTIWHASRGEADWVVVVDMDEFLYAPDLRAYLLACSGRGITAIRTIGYDMVHNHFPQGTDPFYQVATRGVRSLGFDKLCLFRPDAIQRSGFTLGRHGANPVGDVIWPRQFEVLLLHYKHLGLYYYRNRNQSLLTGLRERDLALGWGWHYSRNWNEMADHFSRMHQAAEPVPGLPGGPVMNFRHWGENVVRASNRFDAAWYTTQYPDVVQAAVDPVAHYYNHGWKEGRLPSQYPGLDLVRFKPGQDIAILRRGLIAYFEGGRVFE